MPIDIDGTVITTTRNRYSEPNRLRISVEQHDAVMAEPLVLIAYTKADGQRNVHRAAPVAGYRSGGPACREIPDKLKPNLSPPYNGVAADITCPACRADITDVKNSMLRSADRDLMLQQRAVRRDVAENIVREATASRTGCELLDDLLKTNGTPDYRNKDAVAVLREAVMVHEGARA